jgi:hypothetical protein
MAKSMAILQEHRAGLAEDDERLRETAQRDRPVENGGKKRAKPEYPVHG